MENGRSLELLDNDDLKEKLAEIGEALDRKADISVFKLEQDEAALLKAYRLCDDRGKAAVLETAKLNYNYTLISKRDNFKVVNNEAEPSN